MDKSSTAERRNQLMSTLPGDDVRQIMWRFADRYELQMLVQGTRGVARGPVARLVADGGRNSHEWTTEKASLLLHFYESGITAAFLDPEHGGFIPGIRPGQNTAEYLDYVLTRLTVLGASYLAVISLLPEFLISKMAVPFYFGGTSLLIVVTVTMDTVAQVQSHLLAHQYEGLIKKSRLRGRRR